MTSVNDMPLKPAKTSKRSPGLRQPERTRQNILDAATAEFAAKGLAGARVDEIADRAGTNKRMLYQYFGNKEALWLVVLERAYEHKREQEKQLDVGNVGPVEGMRRLVQFNFRYTGAHPEFIALLNTENLHHARYIRKSAKVKTLYSPLVTLIADLLKRGERDGLFRAGIDPVQLYITLTAVSHFYFSNVYTLSTIFGRDLSTAKACRLREQYAVETVLGYLRP